MQPRVKVVCVIVDATQEAVHAMPYSQRLLATRLALALTARHRAVSVNRAIDLLAGGMPRGSTVPLRPSTESFSVVLVKVDASDLPAQELTGSVPGYVPVPESIPSHRAVPSSRPMRTPEELAALQREIAELEAEIVRFPAPLAITYPEWGVKLS